MKRHRRIIQAPSSQAMYIVAGLPKSLHRDSIVNLARRFPQDIVKGIPSPAHDGALYSATFIETLIRSVGEFVVRRRTNGNAQPAPTTIALLFVPAPDQEGLLRAFDFTVMTIPLSSLVGRNERGLQLRHDRRAVDDALANALAPSGAARMSLNEVKRRIAYQSDNEALLLPPANFMTQDGDLKSVFRDFRLNIRPWVDRLIDFGPTALTYEDVPSRIQPQQKRRPFVDSRGMAFFMAHPTAYDGAVREVETNENVKNIIDALRSLYRFGGPLPQGLHHDAQRSDGSTLGGAIFNCSEKGRIRSNSAYANIYPNDHVRVDHHEKVDR